MKYAALLPLSAALVWPADINFTTGQAARLVIGQPTFTAAQPGTSQDLLGGPHGVAYANDTLFVVDANKLGASPSNHRVLIYRNLSQVLPSPTAEIEQDGRICKVCFGRADTVVGQSAFDKGDFRAPGQDNLRTPTGISVDGTTMAVADTDNNRVLIWFTIPQSNNARADVVLGQPDFGRALVNDGQGNVPTARGLRGPQGVWIRGGKLFVADTGNNRVLIWNTVPRNNHTPADVVVGAPDFTTFVQQDLTRTTIDAKPNTLLTPVAVTSDGVRMFVADLGHNRVLIWNSIPTSNSQPASVVLGQKTFETAVANNTSELCAATGKNADGKDTFPALCEASMEFPRFALSDGRYLFIADGGNDRILVYNSIPTQNGALADAIIGQITPRFNLISDSADPLGVASSGAVRTPLALAWDGRNLYASDPFNRRIQVFTMAERKVPNTGVRNAAQREIFAVGAVSLSGSSKENDEVTVTIKLGEASREYKYKAKANERLEHVIQNLVDLINTRERGGDPAVLATPNLIRLAIILTAKSSGAAGNNVEITAAVSTGATIQSTTSGPRLSGGQDAALIAPGTIVTIFAADDQGLADQTVAAPPNVTVLPTTLGGVQVYFDGIRAPLFSVSPNEINAQVPFEILNSDSLNAFVRTVRRDGSVSVSSAIAVPIIRQNPGLFAAAGIDPRPAIAFHASEFATGTVSVDGSIRGGDIATVVISDREYKYTVKESDTLATVRDGLIAEINQDPEVQASAAAAFTRIRLRARKRGPEGNGIVYRGAVRDGDQVILTATTPALCCANRGPITEDNPALPGQTILLTATGLGLVKPDEERRRQDTGQVFRGSIDNDPVEFVSSLAGGKTANVLQAAMRPGSIGIYEVILELNSDLPTDPRTQLTIAQDIYVSNIVTIAVRNPNEQPQ
ncbi:MAG: hypothetical protein FJW39_03255 [Acidobacteria bacterium]|nr:hypothetical protein [Acidobacteriota bacterium]